ncbi:MAG: HAD-IB family hydrolase [Segetibacter sp.]
MKRIAFFDFDGTITKADSFLIFLLKNKGNNFIFLLKCLKLTPTLILWKLGYYLNGFAKEQVLKVFFKDFSWNAFEQLCLNFGKTEVPKLIRKEALQRILWHKTQGDRVIIVTASIEYYLQAFIREYEIEVIGTLLEVREGKLTGNFSGLNCYGPEKVDRIQSLIKLQEYDEVYCYGNSKGDKEMLALANFSFYKRFQ